MAASIRVLFVDDQPEVRTLASRWLAREGVEVDLAETAEQALEMLESALPDVVCLDRELPGMSGMTALTEMLKRHPSLRVMLVSGDDDEQTARAAREAGARVFLAKPFERVTLFAAVRATLGSGRDE